MKKGKMSSTLFYIASVLFYLVAVIGFVSEKHNSMTIVWFCLGSAFLCLGTVYKKQTTEDEDDSDQE